MDELTQSFSNEIKQYLGLIKHWAWLLALFTVLGSTLAYFFSIRQPKIYQASATVMIDQRQFFGNDYTTLLYNERLSQTYTQMIIQPPTLEGVIEELGLDLSVSALQGRLNVSSIEETQLLQISIQDTDPARAAHIVNTIGEVFARENAKLQESRYQDIKTSLEAQLESTSEQIQKENQALDAMLSLKEETEVNVLNVQLAAYQDIYQKLVTQLFATETDNFNGETGEIVSSESAIEEQLAIIEDEILRISEEITAMGWVRDGQYDLLNTKLNVYKSLYEDLLKDLVLSVDDVTALSEEDESDLASEALSESEMLSTQLQITAGRIQELTEKINELGGGSGGDLERNRLESNLLLYRQTYANLVQSYEQVRLAEIQNTTHVDLVAPASIPTGPVRPNVRQNTMLGAVVGLMIGGGIVFLFEILDDSIKSPNEVIHRLKLPVLGYIGRMDGNQVYPITATEPRSPLAESFRSLRTNIQYASIDRQLFSLMVTSPAPRDGKSTIAANLGVVLAQNQYRVKLIDGDMRKPNLHNFFDLTNREGLTEALIKPEIYINRIFKDTNIENLAILPAGSLPPNPAELMGSEKMLKFLENLRPNTDIVIIDSPPIMAVTDPVVLATRVDGVLLVVRPGLTKLAAAIHAVEQLRQVGANVLGVILNDVENKGALYSQYYKDYYYPYGKYYSHSGDKKPQVSEIIDRVITSIGV